MKIAIPDFVSNSYFPIIAAEHLGCFAAASVDLHVELLFPVTKAMRALRDHRYAFAVGTASAVLSAFPDWAGARILAAVAQRAYWFLVVRADLHATPGDVAAVRGLRIGAAPGVDVALKQLLKEAGIDPERDVQIGPVPASMTDGVSFGLTAARALAEGQVDGFWANGMAAAVATRDGSGTIVLDVRRGLAPQRSTMYTFAALVAREEFVRSRPETVAAAIRGLVATQRRLREDPSCATAVGNKVFPPVEAGLIASLVERDAPYYDPTVSESMFEALQRFSLQTGLLQTPAAYEDVVATEFAELWAP